MITSSQLACSSLNISPQGDIVKEQSICGMCGHKILAGEHVESMTFPRTFTNQKDLVDEYAKYRCGHCASVLSERKFVLQYSTCVFTANEAFPFAKKIHRGWFLINPPKPPFTMTVQASKSQHIVWRSPVSLSTEVFYIGLGDITLKIRHSHLMKAQALVFLLRDLFEQQLLDAVKGTKKKPKKADRNKLRPLGYSDMKGQALRIGKIQKWVTDLVTQNYLSDKDLTPLYNLTSGEAWALDFVCGEGKDTPVKPKKIDTLA